MISAQVSYFELTVSVLDVAEGFVARIVVFLRERGLVCDVSESNPSGRSRIEMTGGIARLSLRVYRVLFVLLWGNEDFDAVDECFV